MKNKTAWRLRVIFVIFFALLPFLNFRLALINLWGKYKADSCNTEQSLISFISLVSIAEATPPPPDDPPPDDPPPDPPPDDPNDPPPDDPPDCNCDPGQPCDSRGGCVDIKLLTWPDQAGPIEIKRFDSSTGVLTVDCRARVNSGDVNSSNISFDCDSIGDSTKTIGPVTMYGGNYLCIITFTGLPTNNDFGLKAVKVYYKGTQVGTANIKALFPRDAKNHPGVGSGSTPNWYYYWGQTGAGSGNHEYDGTTPYYGYYYPGESHIHIGPPASGYNSETGHDGIDTFAETCIHENTHLADWRGFWPSGYVSADDRDEDQIPDALELGLGFDPTKRDSDGDGLSDFGEYSEPRAYSAEHNWPQGSTDSQDWANPGHQSS